MPHILLADDSASDCALVQEHVAGTGWRLEIASTGSAALRLLTEQEGGPAAFNLALLDVAGPAVDGCGVAQSLRKWERANRRPRTPIVAITAGASQEEIDRATKAGADGHLAKPIRRETLLDAVEIYQRASDLADLRVIVPDFIRELAPEFLRRQRQELLAITTALKTGDFGPIQTFAHNMKGCGNSFGFPRLTDLGREMERAAKECDGQSLGRQVRDLCAYLTAVDVA
jgi:CheY-like chemotaxis protein